MSRGVDVELVTARTADGVLLNGALAGPARATAGVLAIHGAWGNFYASPVAALLEAAPARGMRALSMNTRGHDLGSFADGEPCIGFMRDRFEDAPLDLDAAAAMLAACGVTRFAVVAHSYGCHKASYWLRTRRPTGCVGAVLLSPAPALEVAARMFVDGAVEDHIAAARAAVAEGHPHRLMVLSQHAPVPMVAEAATVLSTWGPETFAHSTLHVGAAGVPFLVLAGAREPVGYREEAERTVAAAGEGAELRILDDDHHYLRDRRGMAATILDWVAARTGGEGGGGGDGDGDER